MTPAPQKEYIITEAQLKDMVENGALGYSPYRAEIADIVRSRPVQSGSAEKVLVYSKTIKKSPFKSIKGRELALKDIEDDGYGWTSLVFKLQVGDEICVYRKAELRAKAERERE